ncbi:Anaphase-promoting complex subunit 7 [Entomortierella lignicola]|nr:Anaphase-promoting complex subunit 7 [Entomortierella lignicola]
METGNARQYSSQERLAQLRETESLYNAGLYTSALLITGIQLSTVRRDEKWFQSRALLQYARCLTRLQEYRRSTEYYRRASSLENSPLPRDISGKDSQQEAIGTHETSATKDSQVSASQQRLPTSTTNAVSLGLSLEEEQEKAQRQARILAKEKLIKSASNLAAKARKATIEASAKSTEGINSVRLTNAGPTSIPPVIPRSTTMKKRLASRVDEGSYSNGAIKASSETGLVASGVRSVARGKLTKTEPSDDSARPVDKQYDIDIDYAVSCYKSGDHSTAGEVISKIPESRRTVSVYMLLAKLDRKKINILSEKACWECIAEMQPLAIEAYVKLVYLHVPLAILLNMIPSDSLEKQWMKIYLQGTENYVRMRFQAALSDFSALNERYPDNIDIKLKMALCLKRMGKTVRSCFMYSQARKLDNHILKDMYHYGVCLKQLSKMIYLNKLASDLLSCNDLHPDAWCVQALYWDMKGNKEKALQMVSRALHIHPGHCGALQLRGQLCIETTPLKALQSFREALMIEKDVVTYEGLVNAYIIMERPSEAVDMAKEALRLMPDNAQALAIYGMAIYHAGEQGNDAARDALLKALQMDPGCVQAALGLVMIYDNQGLYEEAIQVSNPNNINAKEGITQVEKILSGGDDEDEDEAGESDSNDGQENDTMDADLDQDHMVGNLDGDDVLTGDDDHELDEDYLQQQEDHSQTPRHSEATYFEQLAEQRHFQTPSRPNQIPNDRPPPILPRQTSHLSLQMQQHIVDSDGIPGFGMNYPTPSRVNVPPTMLNRSGPLFPNVPHSQREGEYDEYEDGGDEMEE